MIEFFNVKKQFDDKLVFKNLHWEIEKNTVVGLVGPNGSGKSTLLRMLSGVLDVDNGFVKINKEKVFDNPEIKEKVLFVSDDPYFFPQSTLTDMQNFYQDFYPNFSQEIFQQLTQEFNLNPKEQINNFSKGMKRQVSIILAFASQVEVLLFDEAFDGLDPLMRFKFRQLIADQFLKNNSTVIISSHNLRELEDICDHIVMIDQQKVVFNQSADDFQGNYHRYRLAFDQEVNPEIFSSLQPLDVSGKSQIFSLILKGDKDLLDKEIEKLNPIINESGPLSLEELYLLELGGKTKDEKTI